MSRYDRLQMRFEPIQTSNAIGWVARPETIRIKEIIWN